MKRFPEAAVLLVGFGLIVAGVVLMFAHQHDEFDFQIALLLFRGWQHRGGRSDDDRLRYR